VPRSLDQAARLLLVLLAFVATLSIAASQSVLGLLAAVLVWRWLRGRAPQRTGLEWPALALAGWALLVIPFSGDPGQSLVYARRWYLLAPIWAAASLGAPRRWRLAVLVALTSGAVVSALVGMVRFAREGGARYEAGGQLAGRAAPLSGYMTGGGLLMIAALVLVAVVLVARARRHRWWAAAALAVVLACLLLTLTRSAWLGFLAGAALITALWRPRWLLVLAAAAALAALVLPGALRTRLASAFDPADPTNTQRVLMWRTGWDWVREHPLVGVGDRDLSTLYREHHGDQPAIEVQGHLHSNLVMFAVIWGLPGLVLALGFLTAVLVQLLRRWRSPGWSRRRGPPGEEDLAQAWCLGALGAWCGLMVAGLFEWNFGDAEVALLFWLVVGMGLGREPAAGRTPVA